MKKSVLNKDITGSDRSEVISRLRIATNGLAALYVSNKINWLAASEISTYYTGHKDRPFYFTANIKVSTKYGTGIGTVNKFTKEIFS